jgi:hypothetical protein
VIAKLEKAQKAQRRIDRQGDAGASIEVSFARLHLIYLQLFPARSGAVVMAR